MFSLSFLCNVRCDLNLPGDAYRVTLACTTSRIPDLRSNGICHPGPFFSFSVSVHRAEATKCGAPRARIAHPHPRSFPADTVTRRDNRTHRTPTPVASAPTRESLESMKRANLQKLCICLLTSVSARANLKTEALIDLVLDAISDCTSWYFC